MSVSAQHGGKAEGLRVRFAPGTSSATYKDTVRGSTEVEYELEAQAGQELLVRVVSNPANTAAVKVRGPNANELKMSCLVAKLAEAKALGLPTASHCFEETAQQQKLEGRTWSATLPESSNYLLSVYRPAGGRGATSYTLLIVVVPRGKDYDGSTLSPADSASLDSAMRTLIDSLRKKNVQTFLSLFSRSRFFYANNPMNEMRIAVPYSELASDLRRKGEWYCTYMARCNELDAFTDNINEGEMWPRVGLTSFAPPGSEGESLTYVKWRKENGRWVIAEIAYPQA
jgi:hypothetical protein